MAVAKPPALVGYIAATVAAFIFGVNGVVIKLLMDGTGIDGFQVTFLRVVGAEVLMGRRPQKSSFAPDVFVFPGGKLDPADRAVTPALPLSSDCIRLCAAPPRLANALAVAALR